jgi:hypothetical protein
MLVTLSASGQTSETRKPVPLLAKIVNRNKNIFTIRYLSESDDKT